jgi:hypothetical protein
MKRSRSTEPHEEQQTAFTLSFDDATSHLQWQRAAALVGLVVQTTMTIIAREGFELIQVKNKSTEGAAAQS